MKTKLFASVVIAIVASSSASAICPYDANCLNNPYGGREASGPGVPMAPFGQGSLGAAFSANPLRRGPARDPYGAAIGDADERAAGASADTGSASSGTKSNSHNPFEGIDRDVPKQQ
jgi:hypothetical protein